MAVGRSWRVWSSLVVTFVFTVYMTRIQVQKNLVALPKQIIYEDSENTKSRLPHQNNEENKKQSSTSVNVAEIKFEEWKSQYSLPSIIDNETSDLTTRFTSRRDLLKEGCQKLKTDHESLRHQWSWQSVPGVKRNNKTQLALMQIQHQGHYGICVIPKVGSTTWRRQRNILLKQKFISNHLVKLIQIRHPLERLRSAYTDKFLGGEPISAYTDSYKSDISSGERWIVRWESYWLPALISTGQLQMPESFQKAVLKLKKRNGFHKHLRTASKNAYISDIHSIKSKFGAVSFTFEEFLRHVLWTKDLGLGDHHWIPQTELCNVCAGDFEYILKLESIEEEIPYILQTLNYTNIPVYKQTHSSKESVMKSSYIDFYKDISDELLRKTLELYKFDFLLFGYSI